MTHDTLIKILSNETLLKALNDAGWAINWSEVKDSLGNLLKPATQEPKFDPTNTKNFGLTGTLVGSIRADIDDLKRDFHATRMFPQFDLVSRLIDIVDRLEQRPAAMIQFTPTTPVPNIFPTIAPQPWQPYPNYPGGTICKAQSVNGPNNLESTGQSVSDATGVSNEEPL